MTHGSFAALRAATCCGLAMLPLAACGGGSGTTASTAATSAASAPPPSSVTATMQQFAVPSGAALPNANYDPTSDTITVSDGGGAVLLAHDSTFDVQVPGFKLLNDGSSASSNWFLLGQSGSKDLQAGVAAVNASGGASKSVGGGLARMSDGTVPSSGSAVFRGHYAAILQDAGANHNTMGFLRGDATLNADFGSGTVSGSITNRGFGGSYAADDITLSPGTIGANGTFTGMATGGGVRGLGTDTVSGRAYNGLFGDSGREAAGGLQILHTLSGSSTGSYTETGAFIVSQ